MKAVWMPCPRCNGSSFKLVYTPHVSQPDRVGCDVCLMPGTFDERHWANDLSCIAVTVPESSPLPRMDSIGRLADA